MAKVYISSTFSDLKECRESVYGALRRMGHDVISMEDYTANSRRPLDLCLRDVARCDLYIGIFAWRYGFIPVEADPASPGAGNPERKSITEIEYLHATSKGKDCLIFLLHEEASWPKSRIEGGEGAARVEALRVRLADEHVVDFFVDARDLAAKVSTAVAVWQEQQLRPAQPAGPAKDSAARGPLVNIARLPVTGAQLFGRDEQLRQLSEAWDGGDTNVLSLIAWGGVGKSALVNYWQRCMARDDYRGAERVYAWSFYRQGTSGQGVSADQFIDAALRWFGDPEPTAGSPWDKGERLARLVRNQRTLLLLDGLEPLQFPPVRGHQEGALKEHSMQALLRELAAHNPGLCLITSRLAVADLANFEGDTSHRINLEHLSPQAGAEVLRVQGVKGEQAELERTSAEFGGHALALTLLGSYLKNVHDGDIARRDRVDILREDEEQGGHARRVMASYEKWFGEGPELSVLRILGLFDRPADGPSIAALRAAPAIPAFTDALQGITEEDWRRILNRLCAAKLVADKDPNGPDTLDAHPLVREYFKRQLKGTNPNAWREGNSRLYEHLRDTTKEFPETIEEMAPLYAAVSHGCAAGRHQEALELFWRRIRRGVKGYSIKMLGTSSTELAILIGFFDRPWQQPTSTLNEDSQAYVLSEAGHALRAQGRLVEAMQPIRAGLEAYVLREEWKKAAIVAVNLSEIYVAVGDMPQALSYARRSIELIKRDGDTFQLMVNTAQLACVLYHAGQLSESEDIMRDAEKIQKERQPECPLLYSLPGYRYCALLLHQGRYDEVQTRASTTLGWAKQAKAGLLSTAFEQLSLGRAYLLKAQHEGTGDVLQAADFINRAVNSMRQAGFLEHLSRGLLSRAELHRVEGEFDLAELDLDEAMLIAVRGGMKLNQADCHLEYARLYLAGGNTEKARKHLAEAKGLIDNMRYHLRDKEVQELEGVLGR